jgi:hypothetical protein
LARVIAAKEVVTPSLPAVGVRRRASPIAHIGVAERVAKVPYADAMDDASLRPMSQPDITLGDGSRWLALIAAGASERTMPDCAARLMIFGLVPKFADAQR